MATNKTDLIERKILIGGLDNSGKTSLILSLQGNHNLLSYYSLEPTKSLKIERLIENNNKFLLWELGGQKRYRSDYLKDFSLYSQNVHKFIYVIDIQDQERYEDSIKYLKEILLEFEKFENKPQIAIYLHKFDPDIVNQEEYSLNRLNTILLNQLRSTLQKRFDYSLFRSTIYTIFRKTEIF